MIFKDQSDEQRLIAYSFESHTDSFFFLNNKY